MISAKRFYWLAQFGGWTAYCGLLIFSVYSNNPENITEKFMINILVLIFTGISVTHVQRLVFIKRGWLDLKLPRLLPWLILSTFVCSVILVSIDFITDYLTELHSNTERPLDVSSLIVRIFAGMILILFWNAIYFTFHLFQKSRNQEISNLALAASKRESELKNLRSQLNPHFLFNSLNSIRALVDIDPQKAKTSITTLSNLLRQSLLMGKENLISLSDELQVAKSYLDLEKVRFEDRLQIEWEIEPSLEAFQVPPFSLQMMIENAIKHGISNLIDGGLVKVAVYQSSGRVIVEVRNTGNLKKVVDLGVGIQNVRRRLALQYGAGASFTLNDDGGEVVAQMTFEK